MRTCVLFGKPYEWVRNGDGVLELVPVDIAPVRATLPEGMTLNALLAELGRIEEQANVGR